MLWRSGKITYSLPSAFEKPFHSLHDLNQNGMLDRTEQVTAGRKGQKAIAASHTGTVVQYKVRMFQNIF